jgi:very-short-patch-repair endonuclease
MAMSLHFSTKQLIEKAVEIHGNKYNYSKFRYKGIKIKSTIICLIHGEFEQSPDNHLHNKRGCPKCGRISSTLKRTSTLKEFIKKSSNIHKNKYDYSKFIYTDWKTKSIIICPIHGKFEQMPNSHLSGCGCPKCGFEKIKLLNKTSLEQFLKKSRKIHSNKYDYSRFIYTNSNVGGIIRCPEHGDFLQRPKHHICGVGCPKCVGRNKTTVDFIEEAEKVHGIKFNYAQFCYVTCQTKGNILCPEHGKFEQTPSNHLRGQGCPKCKNSLGESKIRKWLEKNKIKYSQGKTFKNCKNIRLLRFDFCCGAHRLLIEYDGVQHFNPVKQFDGILGFEKTIKNDSIKNKWASENNYKLLRISYTQFNNIDKILSEEIKK